MRNKLPMAYPEKSSSKIFTRGIIIFGMVFALTIIGVVLADVQDLEQELLELEQGLIGEGYVGGII